MSRTIERLVPAIAGAALLVAGCGEPGVDTAADGEADGPSPAASETARSVDVGLTEYRIDMPRSVPAGPTVFHVSNDGTEEHNFEVENGGMEEALDENLAPGETAMLEVDLEPGTYEVYCPVDDHDERGMRLDLEVTEAPADSV